MITCSCQHRNQVSIFHMKTLQTLLRHTWRHQSRHIYMHTYSGNKKLLKNVFLIVLKKMMKRSFGIWLTLIKQRKWVYEGGSLLQVNFLHIFNLIWFYKTPLKIMFLYSSLITRNMFAIFIYFQGGQIFSPPSYS